MDDIILEENVREQIKPIGYYIKALENGFFKTGDHSFKPGFMALFYGAPGTGKQCWQEFLPIRTVSICTM